MYVFSYDHLELDYLADKPCPWRRPIVLLSAAMLELFSHILLLVNFRMTYWLFLLFNPSAGVANLKYLTHICGLLSLCSLLLLVGSAYQQITEFTYSNQYLCKQCGKMAFDISIKPCCFFKVVPQKKFFNIIKIMLCERSRIWNDTIPYLYTYCICRGFVCDLCGNHN